MCSGLCAWATAAVVISDGAPPEPVHPSSYQHVSDLVARYLDPSSDLTVIDVGSCDVNGSYRPLFEHATWRYIGVDIAAGPNVEVILSSPYCLPFGADYADVVVSGQAFEHIEFFWLTILEIAHTLKPGGLLFLLAPSRGPEHRFPVDCWRFYPDGFRALGRFAGLEIIEVDTDWISHPDADSAPWGDTVGVFRKPRLGMAGRMKSRLIAWLRHRVLSPM